MAVVQSETALVVLSGEVSRRLIGRAVAALPQVQARKQAGRMVVVGGSTTRHVAEALTGEDPGLASFTVGWIRDGALGESPTQGRGPGPLLFDNGEVSRGWPGPLLERFEAGDIYIKGGNALDPQGNTAVLMAHPFGGTIGAALAILMARGGELIVPISLEKLIPSIPAACSLLGQGKVDRTMGTPVGYMPIMAGSATVVTEIEAFAALFGVKAPPVAAGGLDDCAGAVVLHLQGVPESIEAAWSAIHQKA